MCSRSDAQHRYSEHSDTYLFKSGSASAIKSVSQVLLVRFHVSSLTYPQPQVHLLDATAHNTTLLFQSVLAVLPFVAGDVLEVCCMTDVLFIAAGHVAARKNGCPRRLSL